MRINATPNAIRNVNSALQSGVIHLTTADELDYITRPNDAVARCRGIHNEIEKMTFFVDGSLQCTKPIFARFRELTYRNELTVEVLVHFSRDGGVSYTVHNPVAKLITLPSVK